MVKILFFTTTSGGENSKWTGIKTSEIWIIYGELIFDDFSFSLVFSEENTLK